MALFDSIPPPRRIAVLRALQVGDMLCAVPALRALRAAYPEAHIALLGLPWARELVRRLPGYLDELIPFPGHAGLPEQAGDAAAAARFADDMRARRFDLLVQMHGDGRLTNEIAAGLGPRILAGFRRPDRHDLPRDRFLVYPDRGAEVRRLTALMGFLGAPDAGEALEFPLLAADRAELAQWPALARLPSDGYICVHPGGRAPEKRWPAGAFAAVADALHAESGLPIVVTGSASEQPIAAAVRAAMRSPSVDAALPTSLGALAALIAGARLLVSNDTGASHLAAALQVPSVVIFRCTDVARWAPLNRTLHAVVWDPPGQALAAVLDEARRLLRSSAARAA